MIILGLLLKGALVYALVRKRHYGCLSVSLLLSLFLLSYVPVYHPEGVTVLDFWKYEFILSAPAERILWKDIAFEMIVIDVLMAAGFGLALCWSKVTQR